MAGSWLASITRGPPVAQVRAAALDAVYVVTRARRGAASVTREDAGAPSVAVAASERRVGGPDWQALARGVLLDATGCAPPTRLASDFARFIVVRIGGEHRLSGAEIAAWLASWRPALWGLFGAGR